jgi:hypothetical protein
LANVIPQVRGTALILDEKEIQGAAVMINIQEQLVLDAQKRRHNAAIWDGCLN